MIDAWPCRFGAVILLGAGHDSRVPSEDPVGLRPKGAENDPLAIGTREFFGALQCPKTLMPFAAGEGAGDHCGMHNRTILNDRALDWLDDVL